MGFSYNDTASADMGIRARLTSWQVCGSLRNYISAIPGRSGVADFGADFDYREISVSCSIPPKKSFAALVAVLDDIALWLDPAGGLKQLVFDDVPDRYFMARLREKIDCERLLVRSAGSFDLKFFCPDPFAYAVEDEEYTISTKGTHTVKRTKGNINSNPVYRIKGVISSGVSNYITITTNGSELKIVNASLASGETLVVDTDMMTAYVEDSNGDTLRNGLPYLKELNFPTLNVGNNTVVVAANNATFTSLEIQATYNFTVSTAGTYDIAIRLCYPFWDKNGIYVSIDGATTHYTESRLWWPYWRTTFWTTLASGIALSAGSHTIRISLDVKGVQFYGFRVCDSFSEKPSAGDATYTLAPRQFKDVNGDMVGPDRGFKLTLEMLRRKPDSALVWYEDFRDYGVLATNYWTTLSGEWEVWRSEEYSMERVYSQLEGSGKLAWKYNGFSDIHLRARLAFCSDGGGRAGIFCGDLFCCLNYDSQAVELYNGSTLLGRYSTDLSKTPDAALRDDPSMYTVEMRIRGNKVRVYSGASYTLRFTATVSGFSGGYAGYRSDHHSVCELLRLGDAWTYEPYERFDVIMPDGTSKSYGRISRSNCTWNDEFQVFTLTADVEETSTRSEDISMDYDFFHSDVMTSLTCGNDYTAKVIPVDINIWISRLFLGDADGFSILCYQDVDSLVYWANQAAYRWKLRGMCMWSLGQEDLRLWEWLPKQI